MTVLVDTVSSTNAIDEKTYEKIKNKVKQKNPPMVCLRMAQKTKLAMVGKFTATIENENIIGIADVYVAKGNYSCIF